jgi:hypothetical protein
MAKDILANSKFKALQALLIQAHRKGGMMHIFDPTGELHLQQLRAARKRELQYALGYASALLLILTLVLFWGGGQ